MRPLVPILLVLATFPATARAAGPIADMAKPAPATRVAPPAETGSRSAARAVQPDPSKARGTNAALRLSPEEQALLSIREEAQARVGELARRSAATNDPAARLELQRQAIEIKQQAQVRFLETKISFARSRGDFAAVQELELTLDRLIHPPARAVPAEPQTLVKGGAR
jgi:hypothetical protein